MVSDVRLGKIRSEVITALDTKPAIMGHSFGGAFVQLLFNAGFDTTGVSIDGAAVKRVKALPFSEIKATFPVLHNPANKDRAVPITEKEFHYAFTNNPSNEESKAVYDRYAVPESGRILFQGGFANFTPQQPRTITFPTTIAHRCYLFLAVTTTSCLQLCSTRTTRKTPSTPKRSRDTNFFRDGAITPAARTAGNRSLDSRTW
jgi:hypothetical protein